MIRLAKLTKLEVTQEVTVILNNDRNYDCATYQFCQDRGPFLACRAAWSFMRACERAGLLVGYPDSVVCTVSVSICLTPDREAADKLADEIASEFGISAECCDYKFASQAGEG